MKLSFSTLGCPDWTIERAAEMAGKFGYGGVELRVEYDGKHLSPDASRETILRAAELFRSAGAPVFSLSGYPKYSATESAKMKENADLTRKLIEMAVTMGVGLVRVYGGMGAKDEPLQPIGDRVIRALRPLAREAFDKGVRLAVETHDIWSRGSDLITIIQGVDSPGLAVCFDIHNTFLATGEWKETYAVLKPHIAYCHVKDRCPAIAGASPHVMLGAGDLPLREILQTFAADGFDGYLSFEWEKRWRPDLDIPERVFPQYVFKMKQAEKELGLAQT